MRFRSSIATAAAVMGAGLLASPTAGQAATYSAVDQFNNSNAAGSTWTYGTSNGVTDSMSLLANFTTDNALFGAGNTATWYYHTGSLQTGGACPPQDCPAFGPFIAKNTSGMTLTVSDLVWPANVLLIAPGDPLSTISGPLLTIVRWTAPTSGTYDISGYFTDLQQATVNLTVVVNGLIVPMPGIPNGGLTNTFQFNNTFIASGGTVDFIVGSRGLGEALGPQVQFFDAVGLSAVIQTAVPEPATVSLLGLGVLCSVIFRGRIVRAQHAPARKP